MKALKIIGIILLVLILIILVLGLFAPREYVVERSITIDAPQLIVFRHVQFWKNWQPWSPWANIDSTMKVTYEGVDGTKGSFYKWTGKDVGEGIMTNTGIKSNEEIAYHLQFIKPWESEADGYVRLAPETAGTKVTWGMFGKEKFFGSIINWIMNIDKMVGGDFEKGLALLKQRVNEQMAEINKFQIQQIDFPAHNYAVIQQQVPTEKIQEFFTQSYGKIMEAMGKAKVTMTGAPVGLYYSWDETMNVFDMAAAIPIPTGKKVGDITTIQLPATKSYLIDYYGSYEKIENAHFAFDVYFAKNGLKQKAPVMEEYVTDPASEPDSSKWLTRIYYFTE